MLQESGYDRVLTYEVALLSLDKSLVGLSFNKVPPEKDKFFTFQP